MNQQKRSGFKGIFEMLKQPVFLATLLLSIVCGLLAHSMSTEPKSDFAFGKDLPEVLQLVDRAYVDEVQLNKLQPGLYQGALEGIDERASYLPPGSNPSDLRKEVLTRTGLALSKKDGYLYILSVVPTSPADKAGIHSGVYCLDINQRTTTSMSLQEAVAMIAEATEEIELKLDDNLKGKFSVKLTPVTSFKMPEIGVQKLGSALYSCKLPVFSDGWQESLKAALEEIKEPNARFILDLRCNAWGTREDLKSLCNLFLGKGALAHWRGSKGIRATLENSDVGYFFGHPLYLLIDATTSESAEEFSAIAKDKSAAKLIGRATLGFTSAYKFLPLSNGGYIYVATETLELQNIKMEFKKGVKPDTDLEETDPTDEQILNLVKQTPFNFAEEKSLKNTGMKRSSLQPPKKQSKMLLKT